jgi:hypothetical protein
MHADQLWNADSSILQVIFAGISTMEESQMKHLL